MWGTKAYYRRQGYGLKYQFEYGVAERLGRKLAKYFVSSGKRFYAHPVSRKKWGSLYAYASEKKLLDSVSYGFRRELHDAGAVDDETWWREEKVVHVRRGCDEILVACFIDCPPAARGTAFDLINEYVGCSYQIDKTNPRRKP